jgi:tetratricopeptide (TPR) repeat protein
MKLATSLLAVFLLAAACPLAHAQRPSKEFGEAFRQGQLLLRDRKLAEAQAPLERALKLAADDQAKLEVYQALVPVYRDLPETEKFVEAQEFIIRHAERKVGRRRAARDVTAFLFQRGKATPAIARYEAALKSNTNDQVALEVLAEMYFRVQPNPTRAAELQARLDVINTGLATALATRLEQDADAAPQTAAWLLKDAASAWLEAGDKAKALAAAKKSLAQPPEQRSTILTYQWRDGLGDVLLAAGEPALAVQQFEAAVAASQPGVLRQSAEKKLAEARARLAKNE